MKLIRLILGRLILLSNWLFTPASLTRDPKAQVNVDKQTSELTLYQYEACPFCVKVRRSMVRHALHIETRDVKRSASAKQELLAGGGKLKVPCLRIENKQAQPQWLYESTDIIDYLKQRFKDA